jgi:hypothetical protein
MVDKSLPIIVTPLTRALVIVASPDVSLLHVDYAAADENGRDSQCGAGVAHFLSSLASRIMLAMGAAEWAGGSTPRPTPRDLNPSNTPSGFTSTRARDNLGDLLELRCLHLVRTFQHALRVLLVTSSWMAAPESGPVGGVLSNNGSWDTRLHGIQPGGV